MTTTAADYEVDPGLDPSKALIIRPTVTTQNDATTKVTVRSRHNEWLIDEPPEKGGTDLGPTPLESLLGALSGCETVVLKIVADAIGFKYSGVSIECEGVADARGARGVKGVRPYFMSARLVIKLQTNETERRIDLLRRNVEQRCPISNLFKDAGVEMDVTWDIVPE